MLYYLLANLVLIVHGLFIVFVVLGGLLVFWRPWVAWIHIPVALYGIAIEWIGWVCPLTPLENHFRRLAGQEGYSGGFIEHYLVPLIYPVNYTPTLQIALGAGVLLANLLIYGWLLFSLRH